LETRLNYLRKDSFDKDHVIRFLNTTGYDASVNKKVEVSCITINKLIDQYWKGRNVNLLVIDAEGHEPEIIRHIDFDLLFPEVLFFESQNLGSEKEILFDFLSDKHYKVKEIGWDCIAIQPNSAPECINIIEK